jgi:hypothetical protein
MRVGKRCVVSGALLDTKHTMVARVSDVEVAGAGMSYDAVGFAERGV